ncbi:MAG: Dam family site-specific DNA-(adenine-N6)-methyltransferase [Clostridia bacterium]|nr:Dam family site-specific DNA-(adenine-N6)-methyltransferase [Clostridia bacterium]
MLQYMSTKEAAEKWKISQRRVSILCAEGRIEGVAMLGNMWIIPRDAEKPEDARMTRSVSPKEVHPFVKWAGGKSQVLETLQKNLPQGLGESVDKYAEPFVGGGALLFALLGQYHFKEVYVNDNNKELMNAYETIKTAPEKLILKLKEMQEDYNGLNEEGQQAYYYDMREEFNQISLSEKTAVKKAALFLFLNKTCFNGLYRVNKSGKFNVPAGKYKNPLICDEENIRKISAAIQNVTVRACHYTDVLNFADENTFVYFDPPYRPLSKTSGFTAYGDDGFTDKDQKELADLYKTLAGKGVKVMLSNSDPKNIDETDNFFDELYADFTIQRIHAVRMINSDAKKRGNLTELLITNY